MEFLIYTILPFIIISRIFYYFRKNVSLISPLATFFLFCFFFIGTICLFISIGDVVLWMNEDANIKTTFHSETLIGMIEEYPIFYIIGCILLTLVFKSFYHKLLKLDINGAL